MNFHEWPILTHSALTCQTGFLGPRAYELLDHEITNYLTEETLIAAVSSKRSNAIISRCYSHLRCIVISLHRCVRNFRLYSHENRPSICKSEENLNLKNLRHIKTLIIFKKTHSSTPYQNYMITISIFWTDFLTSQQSKYRLSPKTLVLTNHFLSLIIIKLKSWKKKKKPTIEPATELKIDFTEGYICEQNKHDLWLNHSSLYS